MLLHNLGAENLAQGQDLSVTEFTLPRFALVNTARGLLDRPPQEYGNPYYKLLGFESSSKLLQAIEGKRVLDLGSGKGIFARDVILSGVDAEVHSLNPSLLVPCVKEEMHIQVAQMFSLDQASFTDLESTFNQRVILSNWDNIDCPADYFDIVLSNHAFPIYCVSEAELLTVITELNRVCKESSELRFYPVPNLYKETLISEFEKCGFQNFDLGFQHLSAFKRL